MCLLIVNIYIISIIILLTLTLMCCLPDSNFHALYATNATINIINMTLVTKMSSLTVRPSKLWGMNLKNKWLKKIEIFFFINLKLEFLSFK